MKTQVNSSRYIAKEHLYTKNKITQLHIKTVKKAQFYLLMLIHFILYPRSSCLGGKIHNIHPRVEQTEKNIIKMLESVMKALMNELFCSV